MSKAIIAFVFELGKPITLHLDIGAKKGSAMMKAIDDLANKIDFPDKKWDRWNLIGMED